MYVPKYIVPTVPIRELLALFRYLGRFSLNSRKPLYKLVSKLQRNIKVIFQSKNLCSFKDFTFLNYESDKLKRLLKKSLLVTEDKPLLKKQVKSLKLELFSFNSTYTILLYLR